ncbi:zinc finger protein 891 isoform X2 [Equus asinus]|uniref:zinc finger protein 891 isoform X2 n=1 Tax=Equus asinus TaxID=9793 RepID=UPI001D04A843|nr:zinc finger protein 891 isoform X2 [Equus asinus]XP_044632093.1 zinc finger protein 891 isoform X2 [Equus asinus]XP_044632094.1 zinc finger protein 891 isoform X2 [Equus asinus]
MGEAVPHNGSTNRKSMTSRASGTGGWAHRLGGPDRSEPTPGPARRHPLARAASDPTRSRVLRVPAPSRTRTGPDTRTHVSDAARTARAPPLRIAAGTRNPESLRGAKRGGAGAAGKCSPAARVGVATELAASGPWAPPPAPARSFLFSRRPGSFEGEKQFIHVTEQGLAS